MNFREDLESAKQFFINFFNELKVEFIAQKGTKLPWAMLVAGFFLGKIF